MIGDLEAAGADYARAYAVGWDAEPGNALLLAQAGEVEAALAALDRTLSGTTWFHLQRGPWLKAHKAWIAARGGKAEAAREVLRDCAIEIGGTQGGFPSIHALLAEAQANLINEGEPEAIQLLLLARQLWTAAGIEFHDARLRVEIAGRLHDAGDRYGARCELDAAEHLAVRIGSDRIRNLVGRARAAQSEIRGGIPDTLSGLK
jgi:hypothetical protein